MRSEKPELETARLGAVFTMVLWMGCLAVGVMGQALRYPRAPGPARAPGPMRTTVVKVELAPEPAPLIVAPPPPPPAFVPSAPPSAPEALGPPAEPAMEAVAAPSAIIAFALPVKGPTRVVATMQAGGAQASGAGTATRSAGTVSAPVASRGAGPARPAAPAVQQLTFGQGEGQQPPPEYPREAVLGRQQGVVVVRFSVGEDGRVTAARAATACRWPLLNQAALRAVRDTWLFQPGPARTYEVSIQFQLRSQR